MLDQHPEATAAATAAAPSTRGPRRLLNGRLRSAAISAVSLMVVLTGTAYVLAPRTPALEMSVDEISSIPDYDRDITAEYSLAAATVAERRRFKETVWGKLVSQGVPVSQARLVLQGATKKVRRLRATIRIGRPGTFRSVVHLRPGRYRFTMSLEADGRTRSVSKVQTIRNRRFYGVGVLVRESGIVTMLPITTY